MRYERKERAYDHNPFVKANGDEFLRIQNMTREQLLNEIETWEWSKQ